MVMTIMMVVIMIVLTTMKMVVVMMIMVMIMMMMMEVGRSNLESGGMIFANPRVSQNHVLLCQMSNLTEVIDKMKFSREGDVLC